VTAPVELIREGIPRLAPGRLMAARCALCAPSAAGEEDAFALTRDALANALRPRSAVTAIIRRQQQARRSLTAAVRPQ
jgi:hypothetical protein